MKFKWKHPKIKESEYKTWRSAGELQNSEEFRELITEEEGVKPINYERDEALDVNRRDFLKLFGGASLLASGLSLSSCRRPEAQLIPYTKSPEWVIPGKVTYFTSVLQRQGLCLPVVVSSHEGRPTNLKGNELHPDVSSSGLDSFSQVETTELYNPKRSKFFRKKGKKINYLDGLKFLDDIKIDLAFDQTKRVAVVLSENCSPSVARAVNDLKLKYRNFNVFKFEPIANNSVDACGDLFGNGSRQVVNFAKAKRILSLDCDFLSLDKQDQNTVSDFSKTRICENKEGKAYDGQEMGRLYSVESNFSVTGAMADHRLRLPKSQVYNFLSLIAKRIGVRNVSILENTNKFIKSYKKDKKKDIKAWVEGVCADLLDFEGKSIVCLGRDYTADAHKLVIAINKKLNAYKSLIKIYKIPKSESINFDGDIRNFTRSLRLDKIDYAFSLCENDFLYSAPSDLFLEKRIKYWQKNGGKFIQLGYYSDHSAEIADLHIPKTNFLESWGDASTVKGNYSICQPMIKPLFGAFSDLGILLCLKSLKLLVPTQKTNNEKQVDDTDDKTKKDIVSTENIQNKFSLIGVNDDDITDTDDFLYVQETFLKIAKGKTTWESCLSNGFCKRSYRTIGSSRIRVGASLSKIIYNRKPSVKKLELNFIPDNSVYDGRFFYNKLLQEAPDPITKLTWDNSAIISLKTARDLGVKIKNRGKKDPYRSNGKDFYRIRITISKDIKFTIPLLIVPGQADNVISLPLGYGRGSLYDICSDSEKAGEKSLRRFGGGYDFYPFRTVKNSQFLPKVKAKILNKTYPLALTQEHNVMEGRAIAREGTLEKYKYKLKKSDSKDLAGAFGQMQGMDSHIPENISLYKPFGRDKIDPLTGEKIKSPQLSDENHQWAMAIDLNKCIGCTACLLACQVENNIPVVGKDQVIRGREMHWIRMDRYFSAPIGREDDPEVIPQPVACQHCESAPCESVCPVNATVHSEDGLNVMAYNRCIGTRYCANNCPFKARRFNYFDFNKRPLDKLYWGPLANNKEERKITALGNNPNVSVRMRGVIEKCTYCVQRIQSAKIAQKVIAKNTPEIQVKANVIKTACQEVCEANAIVFGNLKNEKDDVNSIYAKKSPRNYDMLMYLGVLPRTSYLARIKNPNKNMPYYQDVGQATVNII